MRYEKRESLYDGYGAPVAFVEPAGIAEEAAGG